MNMDWFFFCQAKVVSLSISFRRGYKTEINIFFAAERSLNKPLLPLLPLTPQSNSGLRLLSSAFSCFIFNLGLQSCLSVSIGRCKISPGHVEIATGWHWRIERNTTVQYLKIPFRSDKHHFFDWLSNQINSIGAQIKSRNVRRNTAHLLRSPLPSPLPLPPPLFSLSFVFLSR